MKIPIIVVCCVIFLVLVFAYMVPKDYFREDMGVSPSECVCAFDLDHTLSCGDPRPLVDVCRAKGCRLAINTARPTKIAVDIPLGEYGFVKPLYDERDFYYNSRSYMQSAEEVAEVKSGYLQLLRDKYKVRDRKCVILFDDSVWNLESAKMHGFSTVSASDMGECGLHHGKMDGLRDILRRC